MKWLKVSSAVVMMVLITACSSKPMPEALAVLADAEQTDKYYLFKADNPTVKSCYIYYPGGLVEAEAYAPYVADIAAAGAHAFLLKLTLDLAMLDVDAAENAKQSDFAKANCKNYVLGGHSLGGIGIALYAEKVKDDGLLFISSYAHKEGLVAQHPQPVMVVRGSNDLLSSEEETNEAKPFMPAVTQYITIDGGNHAQMGYYGPQNRDGEATISRAEQQQQLVKYTMDILRQMDK
ncbi:alpha/beta hydrolase [Oceanicoccus sp. KOV_DT_Chl]|uniref:alpha/beta hydrolase n=1 Tax=Oceanicoccus sp. KOV_DT_Chl TaxID=1904639 RepID=UPI000C79FC0D|nr:alpha/beta hydrolase [Oceanicoccus sp. KOV_DT_Chl]